MTTAPSLATKTTMLTDLPEWRALAAHAQAMRPVHLRSLFASDDARGTRLVRIRPRPTPRLVPSLARSPVRISQDYF